MALLGATFVAVGIGLSLFTQAGPTNDESAKAAINDLLERRYDAILARDLDAYMNTVDPARVSLRDCERQRFEAYVRLDIPPEGLSVGRVDKFGDYLRVWMSTAAGWQRTFARYDGARWYLSEPSSNELGEDITKEYAGVKVHYRAVEDDLGSVVGDDLASIIDIVVPHAPVPPAHLFELRIATLTGTSGSCFTLGQASGAATTLITLKDVRLTPGYNHISRATAATIEHEALHWLQIDRASPGMHPDWWVLEGWPYLIAQQPSLAERRSAMCTSAPAFEDLEFGLRFDAQPEAFERLYTVASMLVERVSAGSGDTAYWRFFDSYADVTSDPLVRFAGTDGSSFYNAWLEDARRQYC